MIISLLYSKKIFVDGQETKEQIEELFGVPCNKAEGDWFECPTNQTVINIENNYNNKTYVVKPLDTFFSVADKLGLSVDDVKAKAKTKNLFVGQRISF